MLKSFLRTALALCIAASFGFQAVPAAADGMADALNGAVQDANLGIKNAMTQQKPTTPAQHVTQKSDAGVPVAQVPPVQQAPVGQNVGLPTGFGYTADISAAYPFGNIGKTGKAWLPGGVDLVAGYGFNPTTRLVASVYQLQHYPVGFNSGQVPIYLKGFANPIGCASLDNTTGPGGICTPTNINVATKDSINLFMLEKMFFIGMPHGRKLPIVISPTYVSRVSKISASNGNADVVSFASNPPDGPIFYSLHTRSAQVYSLAVTVPFLKTPKMFGTFTASPGWLVHRAGLNQDNKAQLYQILYLEYTPTSRLKFFFEPQSSRDYLPTDAYAQHLFAYFLGASFQTGKNTFAQIVLNSGGPTNESPYGVQSIVCANLTEVANGSCSPVIGGLKATQIQFQFGIGSPSVIPF